MATIDKKNLPPKTWEHHQISINKELEKLKNPKLNEIQRYILKYEEQLRFINNTKLEKERIKENLEQQRFYLLNKLEENNEQEIQNDLDLSDTKEKITQGTNLLNHLESLETEVKRTKSILGIDETSLVINQNLTSFKSWTTSLTPIINKNLPPQPTEQKQKHPENICLIKKPPITTSIDPGTNNHPGVTTQIPESSIKIPNKITPYTISNTNNFTTKKNSSTELGAKPYNTTKPQLKTFPDTNQTNRTISQINTLTPIGKYNIHRQPTLTQPSTQKLTTPTSPIRNTGSHPDRTSPHLRKLFIGSLNIKTTEESLANYFSKFGEIVDVMIKYDTETGISKQFAFIEFISSDTADAVRQSLLSTTHNIDGRDIDIRKARPNPHYRDGQDIIPPKMRWRRLFYSQGCHNFKHAGTSCNNQIFTFSSCQPPHNDKNIIDVHTLNLNTETNRIGLWKFLTKQPLNISNSPPTLQNHCAFPLNKNIYIWGGNDQNKNSNNLYCFNIESNNWSISATKGQSPKTNKSMVGCSLMNKAYIHLGTEPSKIYSLDLSKKTWEISETTGNTPPPRESHSITACGDHIYLWGGHDENGIHRNGDLFYLNMNTKIWSRTPYTWDTPPTRYNHTAVNHNDIIYIFGGVSNNNTPLNDLYSFDPRSEEWKHLKPRGLQPQSREGHICIINKNQMIIQGGRNITNNIINDTWILTLSFPPTLNPLPITPTNKSKKTQAPLKNIY